jgi:hypothetical protein
VWNLRVWPQVRCILKGEEVNRPLFEIAYDIRAHWGNVNFGAEPYLKAMSQLHSITDDYYYDSADSVVRYFLANANGWRGADARRIKAELRAML